MKNCLYQGYVQHRRFSPTPNSFRYWVSFLFVDLKDLPHLFQKRWFFSTNQWNLGSWHRKDHWGDPKNSLDKEIRQLIGQETGRLPQGPIYLMTQFRLFGYGFNPVSFYYAYDSTGTYLESIVAEVNNTPWGEQHCYVLSLKGLDPTDAPWSFKLAKEFHVSPFMAMDNQYQWKFSQPGENLMVHMENLDKGEIFFDAKMVLSQKELKPQTLNGVLLKHPLLSLKVIMAIYFQALKLWVKKCPFYSHPSKIQGSREADPS